MVPGVVACGLIVPIEAGALVPVLFAVSCVEPAVGNVDGEVPVGFVVGFSVPDPLFVVPGVDPASLGPVVTVPIVVPALIVEIDCPAVLTVVTGLVPDPIVLPVTGSVAPAAELVGSWTPAGPVVVGLVPVAPVPEEVVGGSWVPGLVVVGLVPSVCTAGPVAPVPVVEGS